VCGEFWILTAYQWLCWVEFGPLHNLEVTDAQWLNSWGLDCESTLRYIDYHTFNT